MASIFLTQSYFDMLIYLFMPMENV